MLAGSVWLAAQPVAVSASLEASVLRVRLAVLERLVLLVQVLPGRSVG